MGLVRVCLMWIWFLTDIDFLHKAKQQLLNALPLEGDVTVWMNEATNVIIEYCLFKSLRRFGAGIIKFCVWYLSPVVVSAVQACVQTPFRRLSWNTRCQLFLHNLLTTAYELTPVPLLRAQLNVIMSSSPLGISDLLTRSPKKWICTLAWSIRRASISIVRFVSNLLATSHEDYFSQSGSQDCHEVKSVQSRILGCQICHSVNTVNRSKQMGSPDCPAAKQSIASIVHISVLCNCF